MSAAAVGWPLVFANIATFVSAFFWGALADKFGRRWAMIIPAGIGLLVTPLYLMSTDYTMIAVFFALQGAFAGSMYTQIPAYMNERFPTEVRATASAFCYHQGAIFGGLVPLVVTWFAVDWGFGFALPMMVCSAAAICLLHRVSVGLAGHPRSGNDSRSSTGAGRSRSGRRLRPADRRVSGTVPVPVFFFFFFFFFFIHATGIVAAARASRSVPVVRCSRANSTTGARCILHRMQRLVHKRRRPARRSVRLRAQSRLCLHGSIRGADAGDRLTRQPLRRSRASAAATQQGDDRRPGTKPTHPATGGDYGLNDTHTSET